MPPKNQPPPSEILRQQKIPLENIPQEDLQKLWFLHNHIFQGNPPAEDAPLWTSLIGCSLCLLSLHIPSSSWIPLIIALALFSICLIQIQKLNKKALREKNYKQALKKMINFHS